MACDFSSVEGGIDTSATWAEPVFTWARICMGRARIRNMGQARIQNEVREHMCNINTVPVPGAGGADGAKRMRHHDHDIAFHCS